ncbi:MAG: flagellar hook-basal body complex protein, partial [Roseovarius sp.]|nr:flagellar hook-basal body complex protein [Roseovarius sp.]
MSSNVMHVAKTGLNAQQARIQVISNNLANVNTTGFKRDRANFETLLYQTLRPAGAQTSEATEQTAPTTLGTGVRLVSTEKMYTQGSLTTTDNALDLAIDGKGFFQVLMPDGRIGYTRNGTFSQNAEGVLTTASGYVVQ